MAYAAPETRGSTPAAGAHVPSPKLLLAGGAIVLAVAYLVLLGLQTSTVYFLTVSELESRGAAAQGQLFRVSGKLVTGSLSRDTGSQAVAFKIADPDTTARHLPIAYRGGQLPDIVGDDVEIVAEGKLDNQGTFQATTVLAKCPSRLENAPPEEHEYGGRSAAG